MTRFALALARFALPAWVGAAVLFVVNGVQQVTSPAFDSVARDHLALLRFPAYYACGFVLVAGGLIGTLLARNADQFPRRRRGLVLVLLAAALVLMIVDYRCVYTPLANMLMPPGTPRPQNFSSYHRASEAINALHVGLVLSAAVAICLPPRRVCEGESQASH